MRIRNVKNKKEILSNNSCFIDNPMSYKGKWNKCFGNNNPIHLEIGPGKCNFIIENAPVRPGHFCRLTKEMELYTFKDRYILFFQRRNNNDQRNP